MSAIIGERIADHTPLAIASAVGSLYHEFGTTIAIEVIDDEGGVVGARTDVAT
jgi:hypothetical protein